MQAVILAGGKGTRLAPYTLVFPKPMLPVGGQPIIETIVRQLAYFGFDEIVISLGYLGEMIKLFFLDKTKIPAGVRIRYVEEQRQLGTAGAIGIIDGLEEDFLAINGDILTTLNFKDFYDFHLGKKALLSIAVGVKQITLPLGILELNGTDQISKFTEKPTYEFLDNIGVYMYNKATRKYIPHNERLDLNILVERMLSNAENVCGYRSSDPYYWIDIGQHGDYERANEEFEKRRKDFDRGE
jgi:NDP-sugar pyrophosphorylase family protein